MLRAAGWDSARIEEEYLYRRGRVRLVGDEPIRDVPQFADYVLRGTPSGIPVAVLEAKDESHSPGAGLQQAIAYAVDLKARFALSSNGHGVVEQDLATGLVTQRRDIPSPEELRRREAAGGDMRGESMRNRRGDLVPNPLLEPLRVGPDARRLRYYQEAAVTAAIEQVLAGRKRALLALATGTGKTLIARSVVTKFIQARYFSKVLFLVDRVSLWKQAYNVFAPFGDARGLVTGSDIPIHRDIHFATYQTLYADVDGTRLFEHYPRDYFDLIVIDECHRSGYGDWKVILDHFDEAFHLGMTATPKRTDSIDTYEFFAGENRNAEGDPEPAYEYSLGTGIEDGFLATYQVHRVVTNIDAAGLDIATEVAQGAELIVPEDTELREVYQQAQFEREIVIPDRTRLLCADLASKLRTWGARQKTIVFCVTVEQADLVRAELQSALGPEVGINLYAARIVSEERDAQILLEEFQRAASSEPVIATTVDLLTTGVDIPSVRNIVFMKPVASPTAFKQIIGRGSRIDEATGKLFFRVVDYTNATRLFDSWDAPGMPREAPQDGEGVIRGRVVRARDRSPIAGAAVVVLTGVHERQSLRTSDDGTFEVLGLPEGPVRVLASAPGHARTRLTYHVRAGIDEPLEIELHEESAGRDRIHISGVEVRVTDETTLMLESTGTRLTVEQYCDMAGERVRTFAGDTMSLGELWRDPQTRTRFLEQLRTSNVDPVLLALVLARPDADNYDLLAHVAFDDRIQSREERARHLEVMDSAFLSEFDDYQRPVVVDLLDKYRLGGVDEVSTAKVFLLEPFGIRYGGVAGVSLLFGGPSGVARLLASVQAHLYPSESVA